MEPESFAHICLGMAIIGLLALYVVITFYHPKEVEVEELYEKDAEERVRLKGTVVDIIQKNKTSIIVLGHYRTADVIFFTDGKISLSKGQEIRVDGRVQEYRGKKELVADEISLVSNVP
ncbi:MAG: hypothetical protein AABX51_04495 [Nanoarchaeota archaeon]